MDAPEVSKSPRWLWGAALWLGVGLFEATQTVVVMRSQGMHHAWPQLFVTLLFSWTPWALATPAILYLGRRFPLMRLRALSTWLIHLSAAAVINLAYGFWRAVMEVAMNPWAYPAGPGSFTSIWSGAFYNGLLATLILYASILAIANVLDSRERLAQREAEAARLSEQLSKAQLDALRQQIEPHFLFNALNAVSVLVREERNDDALNMIAGLGDLLRGMLKDSRKQRVPLCEELELLDKYLAIQKVRFSDRLRIETKIPPELLSAEVPSLFLQPIVENAFKHGIARRAEGGRVRIEAARLNGRLAISVYNDGPALASEWKGGAPGAGLSNFTGVGLSNLNTRLQGLYGSEFEFHLHNRSDGVEAAVSFPYAKSAGGESL